jgi:hypothetical protein
MFGDTQAQRHLIAPIVGVIAVSASVWVIAIGMRVWMIAIGTIDARRGNAIAAHRDATSVGSTCPSDTATEGDGRHSGSCVVQRRKGHRAGGDCHETEQRAR